jgi:hypothetical protein
MKKIMQALGLVLLAAGIVFAAAGSEYTNNETCNSEWAKFHSAHDQSTVAQSSVDSQKYFKDKN